MTHGDAHLVEGGVLGVGGTGRQYRCNKEPSDYGPHECLPYVVLASFGGTLSILAYMRKLVRPAGAVADAAAPPRRMPTALPNPATKSRLCIQHSHALQPQPTLGTSHSPLLNKSPTADVGVQVDDLVGP